MPHYAPIPNPLTTEPKVEIAAELDDGRRIYRILTESEFKKWQENGGDFEDLADDE
jgi:hypothetical protein